MLFNLRSPLRTSKLPALLLIIAVCGSFVYSRPVLGFHSGGVGECEGCHSMHNSKEGGAVGVGGSSLLKGSDPTSTCLLCHQVNNATGPSAYHVSTPDGEIPTGLPPKQLSPGGDFAWLKKTFTWYPDMVSPLNTSPGERHGHNVVSLDFGYQPDGTNLTAPGGGYPSQSLSCISCHDPHGKYRRNLDGTVTTGGRPIKSSGSFDVSTAPDGQTSVGSYRMLAGSGYAPKGVGGSLAFIYPPPAALAPLTANRSEATSQTRVAYGSGMSDWCRNCHTGNIHNGVVGFKHPTSGSASGTSTGTLDSVMSAYYNSYVKTGDVTGTQATAYLSLVPFEIGTSSYFVLQSILGNTPTKGPDSADGTPSVMCLTCHRAHASGWDRGARWNMNTAQIEVNGKYSEEGALYQPNGQGRSEAEALQGYYQLPETRFDPNQQKLCYKCHSTLPQ